MDLTKEQVTENLYNIIRFGGLMMSSEYVESIRIATEAYEQAQQLQAIADDSQEIIRRGQYRHYKGGLCDVICTATHTETMEEMVVYKHKENVWARPASMWNEIVDTPFGKMKRFTRVESEE